MEKIVALWIILGCAGAFGANKQDQNAQRFDRGAVFQPGMSVMQAARESCAKVPRFKFGECFVRQMQSAGASPQAIAFMHAVDNNGFMRDFKDTGRVDIAFAYYPFAANENQHSLLVNGAPNLIDVDDYKLIRKTDLTKSPVYSALLRKFPNIAVFPGNRAGTNSITAKTSANGAQRFIVPYVLVDGCHACARVGLLRLAFDFDRTGKFIGTKVAGVKAIGPPDKTTNSR